MARLVRLYMHYAGISIRSQMQYRASFAMAAAGHLVVTGFDFAALAVLFRRFGSLVEWSLHEVAVLYGITHVALALAEAFARGFDVFPAMVRDGSFDRLLLRPLSTAFQVAASEIQLMRIGRLTQGLAVLGWALATGGFSLGLAQWLLVPLAILGGACLFSGLFVLSGVLSFWTIETLEVVNTVTYGGVEATQYPLSIYRPWFRHLFTFVVPLACVNFLPGAALMGMPERAGAPEWCLWLAPFAGVLFLLASLQVWRVGVRHYTSTGS